MLEDIYKDCKKDENGDVDLHEALSMFFDGLLVQIVDESQ